MASRKIALGMLSGIALIVAGFAYVTAADVTDSSDKNKALIAAAQGTWDESIGLLSTGDRTNPEECYLWSRRLMDAEVRADKGNLRAPYDAAVAHEKRMLELDRIWSKLARAGLAGNHAKTATRYYLLEAQALVVDARHG